KRHCRQIDYRTSVRETGRMNESIRHLIVIRRIVILVRTAGERSRHVQADLVHECREVSRPSNGDCRSAEEILEDQIPPDDPGDELAERRIAVSVITAGV